MADYSPVSRDGALEYAPFLPFPEGVAQPELTGWDSICEVVSSNEAPEGCVDEVTLITPVEDQSILNSEMLD